MVDEYVRRTAVTRLSVRDEQRELLEATIDAYRDGCQIAADIAWPEKKSKRDIHPLAYDSIRNDTELTSQHAILATHQAAEAIASCHERRSKGLKTSKPVFTAPTVTYDTRTMTLFEDDTVSLSTVGGRIRCPLVLPEDDDGYQWQFIENERWEMTESTLTARDGAYYLHMGFRRFRTEREREANQETAEDGTVLGVDVGVNNLAVTSTGLFVSGGELTHWQNEYEKRRGSLQRTGTRWAHENIQSVGRKENGRCTILLHEASNVILEEARENDCTHLAFEDLTDIRERLPHATWHHRWAFRKLFAFVSYKAVEDGITVRQVNPQYTSRKCSYTDCGFTHVDNRDGDSFECLKCGYAIDADYNAAKNIAVKYAKKLRRSHMPSDGGVSVDIPLNSGSLTVEGSTTVVVA
ncbi:RNA-guided endonuclease InsQ/TnpB family protein [Halococcus salifodinae]|uniref:IS1341-type transposase (TCE32) n=1 Tax=Halococcus salifodinae DSM 8989 TaxID=1227456 RepID=M0N514_9EURY|nr:RNA-guided endonuclease TnpB family protein [Halococcus salifodinae]EMA52214.1 IS1341-type transposase (TCE32) [Halococcus salifodinae DSM 8989]